jgi:hypothetical protein
MEWTLDMKAWALSCAWALAASPGWAASTASGTLNLTAFVLYDPPQVIVDKSAVTLQMTGLPEAGPNLCLYDGSVDASQSQPGSSVPVLTLQASDGMDSSNRSDTHLFSLTLNSTTVAPPVNQRIDYTIAPTSTGITMPATFERGVPFQFPDTYPGDAIQHAAIGTLTTSFKCIAVALALTVPGGKPDGRAVGNYRGNLILTLSATQ